MNECVEGGRAEGREGGEREGGVHGIIDTQNKDND